MFETGNTPVRPPLRPPEQAAPQRNEPPKQTGSPDAQGPKSAPASNAHRYARRAHPRNAAQRSSKVSEVFTAAREMTTQAAHDIRRQFGEGLSREECLRLVSAFRAGVVPRRRAGRRPKPQVTAAYLDWKSGTRGVALYRKHIPGWEKHNRYHRIGEQKALMDAIRSRTRREREGAARRSRSGML